MLRTWLLCVCFLAACSPFAPIPGGTNKPPLDLPPPTPMKLSPVEFKVVHKDNAQKIFSEMQRDKEEPVVFGLTGTEYKNLAVNMQIIKNYILMQQKTIRMYKQYYEGLANDAKSK